MPVYSKPPPWCSVETSPVDWRLYLELRTTVYTEQRNRNVDVQHPNLESGQWQPLSIGGSPQNVFRSHQLLTPYL